MASKPLSRDQADFLARLGGGATFPKAEIDNLVGARPFRVKVQAAGNSVPVYSGRCVVVGALLTAGAATSTMNIYNLGWQGSVAQGTQLLDATRRVAAVKTGVYDGFVNFPITCEDGLMCDLDQTDAEGYIYYVPLPQG